MVKHAAPAKPALTRRRKRELQLFAEDVHKAIKDEAQTILRDYKTLKAWLAENAETRLSDADADYLFDSLVDLQRHYSPNPALEEIGDEDVRGIPKARQKELAKLAETIYKRTISAPGLVSTAKAVFNYATIKLRAKITMPDAEFIKEEMDRIEYRNKVNANTLASGIVLIRCVDAASFDARTVKVFKNSPDGRELASEAFIKLLRQSVPGINDGTIQKALGDGYYEIGNGFITLSLTTA